MDNRSQRQNGWARSPSSGESSILVVLSLRHTTTSIGSRVMDRNVPNWQGFLEHAEMTDVGLRRANNQDSFGLQMAANETDWLRRGHLFIVADGMGAHAAGELASKIAVDTVTLNYFKMPDAAPPEALRTAVTVANSKIHNTGEDNPDFKGMGTTCSALVILPRGAVGAQVGDSRLYRLRGHKFEQLSRDHSLVWEMMAQRGVSESEAFVPKNIITRSLGPSAEVLVDLEGPFPLEAGDTFLLCSDGLSGQVQDAEIGVILAALPPQEAVRVLIDIANLRGGPDNITVIVTRVGQIDPKWQHLSWSGGGGGNVHPLVWVAIGVMAMLAGLAWIGGQPWVAGVALILSLAAVFVALMQRFSGGASGVSVGMTNLGTGPHRTYDATPSAELFNGFSQLIEPVCGTARQQKWQIDWKVFERHRTAAMSAADGRDFLTAIREQCRAIMFLMHEVRQQQER